MVGEGAFSLGNGAGIVGSVSYPPLESRRLRQPSGSRLPSRAPARIEGDRAVAHRIQHCFHLSQITARAHHGEGAYRCPSVDRLEALDARVQGRASGDYVIHDRDVATAPEPERGRSGNSNRPMVVGHGRSIAGGSPPPTSRLFPSAGAMAVARRVLRAPARPRTRCLTTHRRISMERVPVLEPTLRQVQGSRRNAAWRREKRATVRCLRGGRDWGTSGPSPAPKLCG